MTGNFQGAGNVFGAETFTSRGVSDLVVVRVRGGAFTGVAARETARSGMLRLVGPNPVGAHAAVAIGRSVDDATVTLHDALGRTVARLHEGPLASGDEVGIDTSALAPGVYAVRLVGGGTVETRTFVVAR